MTQSRSSLKLNKMVIYQDDHEAYHENFHEGTNIIHGDNGSGKSTILNMIFYALGGHLKQWTSQMLSCTSVIVEVCLNGSPITLKREIEENSRKPMHIYYGNFSDALSSHVEGWKIFSYNMSSSKKSFSLELFDLLEYPEMRTEFESNLTMHQLLRLMFVDQRSSSDSLFIQESFDSPLVREGVGEFLLGIYDDELYDLQLENRKLSNKLSNVKDQIKNMREVFRDAEFSDDHKIIEGKIREKKGQLEKVRKSIEGRNQDDNNESEDQPEFEVDEIKEEIKPVKKELIDYLELKEDLEFDISDSELFIENLKNKVKSLNQSEVTNEELEGLSFQFCPKCLSPIEEIEDNHCDLCKTNLEKNKDQYTRIRQQIKHQIDESESLLVEKRDELDRLNDAIPELKERYHRLQNRLNESVKSAKSSRNEKLDNLYIDQGYLESSIENLTKQLRLVNILSNLEKEEQDLKTEIERINVIINQKKRKISETENIAYSTISDNVKYLVSKDLDRQEDFMKPKTVGIHFDKNTFSLNGHNQFSESSMTLLKKSVALGIFFASQIKNFFRFPRFLIIDNIEDKGMEPERNRNFQEAFIHRNHELSTPNQLIFSTSDLTDKVERERYCVGEYYTLDNKSLKLKEY